MSEFYIGWSTGTSSSKKDTFKYFSIIILIMSLVVCTFTFIQDPYSESVFFYGKQTVLKGKLLTYPVIAIQIKETSSSSLENIPLVGFGKMGPHTALEKLLDNRAYDIELKGTLIQHNGKKIFELTDGKKSILSSHVIENPSFNKSPEMLFMGNYTTVEGEILDPKCYFGAMKPGFGKVHKSCAIRCISGQIPPILTVRDDKNMFVDYYFISDINGTMFNTELYKYVGTKIKITGDVSEINNWKIIQTDFEKNNIQLVQNQIDKNIRICSL